MFILGMISYGYGLELARISASASIIFLILKSARSNVTTQINIPIALWPYGLLLLAILLIKILNHFIAFKYLVILHGQHIRWNILTSPGIPLMFVNTILIIKIGAKNLIRPYITRITKPLSTILSLLFFSQILVKEPLI